VQRRATSPITTAAKPPQTAINTISNVDSLFVSMPLGSWRLLLTLSEGFETLCVLGAVAVVADGEGLIIVAVVAIELVEYSTLGKDSRFVDAAGTK